QFAHDLVIRQRTGKPVVKYGAEGRHLKVCGDLGQVVSMEFDLRNEKNIEEAVRHSDIVYNLIGRDHETRNFTFEQVHVEGAARIAKISREAGVSALNANKNPPSKFFSSKVLDVAQALKRMLKDELTTGETYELFGPREFTCEEVYDLIRDLTEN
ncbi:11822_t:CDS:2, partial [Racocetra persica]